MDQLQENCGIIVCQQIYIPMNMSANICWIFIKIIPNELASNKITSPWTWKISATHEHWPLQIKMIPQYA